MAKVMTCEAVFSKRLYMSDTVKIRRDFDDQKILACIESLQNAIEGEVRFDEASRALYAVDASNYRQTPIGVVIPRNKRDVQKTVKICHSYDLPIFSRGGGTSLAGQCCNHA